MFVRDGSDEQANDLCAEVDSVERHFFLQYVSTFVVPVARFARGSQSIFIKDAATFAGATGISFCNVRADTRNRSAKLIGTRSGSNILQQLAGVQPREIRQKQAKPGRLQLPNG